MPKQEKESPHSQFISIISGIFIVVSTAAILMSVLQNELIYTRIPLQETREFLNSPRGRHLPTIVRFYFYNLQHIAQAALAVSIITLINAMGLLNRKNWARFYFIGFFVVGICWCLGGMVFYEALIPDTSKAATSISHTAATMILHIFQATSFIVSMGFILLFIWLIRKFTCLEIRREFKK